VNAYAGALEAVDRILKRGGDADDVLRAVLGALHERGIAYAAVRFVEEGKLVDGPSVGDPDVDGLTSMPIVYEGQHVGELLASVSDTEFLRRVATLISAYVLVGWDTGGEAWSP
jgi:hypothetical protein